MENKVILVFGLLGFGALALAGLDLLYEGHLPMIQIAIAIGGILVVLTIGGLSD